MTATDNAIEAAQKVELEKRYVKIGITDAAQTLLIVVKNSYNGLIKAYKENPFITLKKEKDRHGLGLQSIRRVVSQLDGEFTTDYDSDEFSLTVLLYPPEI